MLLLLIMNMCLLNNFYHYQMSEPRLTTLSDFTPLSKLGIGSFSTVYKVQRLSDSQIYALKKVRLSSLKQKQKQNAVNEIRILASLNSPYIIGYKEALFEEKHNVLCIVMEYADGGDLQKIIEKAASQKAMIPEKQIWRAAAHIIKGLEVLHSNNILHRDLKSANVFLSSKIYKLGDLNVSKIKKEHMAYTQTGTPYYASPEVWNDKPYDHKSDIWSLGCIIYEMCVLQPPFQGQDMQQLNKSIQKCRYKPIPSCYSKQLQEIIRLCLQKNPLYRLSAQQFLDHYLFKGRLKELGIETESSKGRLLGTIRVPMNPKQFHQNLPKPKYESKNQSMEIPKLSQKPQQKPVQKQRLEPREPIINNFITPQKPKESIRLSQIVSGQRSAYARPVVYSDRVNVSENFAHRSQSANKHKQIQKSLILQSNQIYEYLKEKEKERSRPITSLPRTERHLQSPLISNISPIVSRPESKNLIEQFQRVPPSSEQKILLPKKQHEFQAEPRYYSANKSPPKPESRDKQRQKQGFSDRIMVRRNESDREISPLLKRLELNYQMNKMKQLKNRYVQNSDRKPVMNKLEARLQKYSYPERLVGNKKYNLMPSWW